jgi:hypothetical protein
MSGQGLRWWKAVWAVGVVVGMLALWQAAIASSTPSTAHAAKRSTLRVNASARLTLVKKNGSILRERGTVTGTPAGTVTARFNVSNVAKTTGTMTFKPYGGGSITVTAVVYPAGSVSRFSGSFAVRRGTGKYANAVGSGTLSGSVNRRTWAVSATAKGTLTY